MSIGLVVTDDKVLRYLLYSKDMHFLENDNKRADFPKSSENFRKITEQAITRERDDIPLMSASSDRLGLFSELIFGGHRIYGNKER